LGPIEEGTENVHLLTKLFIVLVSLLAVMIVPLVAVNAVNEESFRGKYENSMQQKNAAMEELSVERATRMAEASAASVNAKEYEMKVSQLTQDKDNHGAEVVRLEGRLTDARSGQDDINAKIAMMAVTQEAQHSLTQTLVVELKTLRTRAVDAERQSVELEEELGIIRSQFEVAEAARRALQEEVAQLTDEKDQALDTIARYVAYIGELPTARAGAATHRPADRNLSATLISVRRSDDSVLAEINAGSRDGLQEGWVMTVADGSRFVGNLRIIEVDVNRATGVIELEDVDNRGAVRTGMRAIARKGQ
jgi:hypothetical protein